LVDSCPFILHLLYEGKDMIRSRTTATTIVTNNGNCSSSSSNNNIGSTTTVTTPKSANKHERHPFFSSKQHQQQRRLPIPFCVVASLMTIAIMAMGCTSIYSILYLTSSRDNPAPNGNGNLRHIVPHQARQHLEDIRQAFRTRYGGSSVSSELLQRGLHAFGSIDYTAQRLLVASQEGRPFVMAFSGYSITVGRGNFFNQSFPFVVQNLLQHAMQEILGVPLEVRNGAIGGIPSFPYGFCLEHFLGRDPDVISWDYSMNEQGHDASVLESWIRQATQQLPHRPMIIMVDTNAHRMHLLEQYAQRGWLKDALAVGRKEILKDEAKVLAMDPLPPGFQEWDEFGAVRSKMGTKHILRRSFVTENISDITHTYTVPFAQQLLHSHPIVLEEVLGIQRNKNMP
jgi:hypothetical protein